MDIRKSTSKLVLALAAGGTSLAAIAAAPSADPQRQQPSHQGMMDQGAMGGMEMIRSCQSMIGSAGASAMAVPKLPPGNEKLGPDARRDDAEVGRDRGPLRRAGEMREMGES